MFNALSDFIIFCRVERRLSELTCQAYERDVRACLDFLRATRVSARSARSARLSCAASWPMRRTHRPAPSSQARTVAALRCFFRFCVESDYLERDPAHVLRTPKKREALPDVLDRASYHACSTRPPARACGSACTPASSSAIVCCSPCSPTAACAAQSCSASTSTTSTSTGG